MRKSWFPRPIRPEGENGESLADQVTSSMPLVLVIEHIPPRRDVYSIQAQVFASDEALEVMKRHKLLDVDIFVDKAAEAEAERRKEMIAGMEAEFEKRTLSYIWSPHEWMWTGLKVLSSAMKSQTQVHVTVRTLLQGFQASGSMSEMTWLAKSLSEAVDRMSALVAAGQRFDAGNVRIFTPGSKPKTPTKKKPGTPPSKWGE